MKDILKSLERLADYLEESHQSELDSCHGGDELHSGPAPESCSYCNAIDEARQILLAGGGK